MAQKGWVPPFDTYRQIAYKIAYKIAYNDIS